MIDMSSVKHITQNDPTRYKRESPHPLVRTIPSQANEIGGKGVERERERERVG